MKKTIFIIALLLALLMTCSALAEGGATLKDTIATFGGQSTISWTADSVPDGGFNVIIEALNPRGDKSLMQLAGNTSGNSVVTGIPAPNHTYRVYLVDNSFNVYDVREYDLPDVPDFEDGNLKNKYIKVSTELRQTDADGNYKRIKEFNASEMNALAAEGTVYSCMKYQMDMPQLAYARTFYVQLVFESPDGYFFTDKASEVTFERVEGGTETVWWDYAGVDYFPSLYAQTGSIPSGQYTAYLYWDGYFVNAKTFTVN